MSNRFNYRCPKCGSPDAIEICAFVGVRLTSDGAEISEHENPLDGGSWCSENPAGCDACGFEGLVKDFEPTTGATVIDLFPTRQTSRS
jgi:hypothetical protein